MAEVVTFAPGGYRYIKGPFQYSAGVAAEPGFEIERVLFVKPLELAQGFAAVEAHLAAIGRPPTAFCACELRSPAPFSEEGFVAFNREYVKTLERWGVYRDGVNPVARTNVCPAVGAPGAPALHAFSYTVPAPASPPASFVIAGGGEAPEFKPNYRDHIVRRGERSPDAMREKVRYVMGVMEGRLAALGLAWRDAAATQAYTVYDIGPFVMDEIVRRGAAVTGLTWHLCRPPVVDLDYEMDVRRAAREIVR